VRVAEAEYAAVHYDLLYTPVETFVIRCRQVNWYTIGPTYTITHVSCVNTSRTITSIIETI
jgi:hypothetical protein